MNKTKLNNIVKNIPSLLANIDMLPSNAPVIINRFVTIIDQYEQAENLINKGIFNKQTTAEYLGIKKAQVTSLIKEGKIKYAAMSNLFYKDELDKYLLANKSESPIYRQVSDLENQIENLFMVVEMLLDYFKLAQEYKEFKDKTKA